MSASRVWVSVYLHVWKVFRPDKDVMNRIKQAFEALKDFIARLLHFER